MKVLLASLMVMSSLISQSPILEGSFLNIIDPPKNEDYVKVKDYIPTIFVDLKYATKDNFTKTKIYDFKEAYLR